MVTFGTYLNTLTTLIPVFTAVVSAVLVWMSFTNSLTQNERRLKRIAIAYFCMAAAGWLFIFFYGYAPQVLVVLNPVCFLSFILVPIFFYRIIRFLTRFNEPERFSLLHYLFPVLVVGAMLLWSFSVPFDTQLEILASKGQSFPAGYEAYGRFFTSKLLFRAIFGLIYSTLIIVLLVRYYRRAHNPNSLVRRPALWVLFLVGLSLASLVSTITSALLSGARDASSPLARWSAVGITFQYILLTYHIVRRNYLLYVVREEPGNREEAGNGKTTERRQHSGSITHRKLTAYFRNEKPYLRTNFGIEELVEALDVNRTVVSAFINKNYGMNFKGYVNSWRLREMERLKAMPSHAGKAKGSYVTAAGFADLRQYHRALDHENGLKGKEINKEQTKGNEQ